jgi:hypothetical protein
MVSRSSGANGVSGGSRQPLQPSSRIGRLYRLFNLGRWLAQSGYGFEPAEWTREVAAAYVAAVDRSKIGQWSRCAGTPRVQAGEPFKPATKASALTAQRDRPTPRRLHTLEGLREEAGQPAGLLPASHCEQDRNCIFQACGRRNGPSCGTLRAHASTSTCFNRSKDRRTGPSALLASRPGSFASIYKPRRHSLALPEGSRTACGLSRSHLQPSSQGHHSFSALQRERTAQPVRTTGVARSQLSRINAPLHKDHANEASQVVPGRWLIRQKHPSRRGPYRSGFRSTRKLIGRAVEAIRSRSRVLLL